MKEEVIASCVPEMLIHVLGSSPMFQTHSPLSDQWPARKEPFPSPEPPPSLYWVLDCFCSPFRLCRQELMSMCLFMCTSTGTCVVEKCSLLAQISYCAELETSLSQLTCNLVALGSYPQPPLALRTPCCPPAFPLWHSNADASG